MESSDRAEIYHRRVLFFFFFFCTKKKFGNLVRVLSISSNRKVSDRNAGNGHNEYFLYKEVYKECVRTIC